MQINDVLDAIESKLHETFGDGYIIYTELTEQGFEEPCFFIALLELEQKKVAGNRYHKTIPIDIYYFGENNRDAYSTADTLLNEMEYIRCINGELLHGTKMRAKIENGVLHFLVNYNMHLYKVQDPIPVMEDLTIKPHTK